MAGDRLFVDTSRMGREEAKQAIKKVAEFNAIFPKGRGRMEASAWLDGTEELGVRSGFEADTRRLIEYIRANPPRRGRRPKTRP